MLFAVLFKPVMWGIAENRQFHESDWGTVSSGVLHFSSYHIWLSMFFVVLDWGFACALSGVWYIQLRLTGFFVMWDILVLDVTWWTNRYLDITHLGQTWSILVFAVWHFPTQNHYDGGQGKATQSPSDWDAGGMPLWLGVYCWWWVLTFALIVMGVAILGC